MISQPTHLLLVPAPPNFTLNALQRGGERAGYRGFIVVPAVVDLYAPLGDAGAFIRFRAVFRYSEKPAQQIIDQLTTKTNRLIGMPYMQSFFARTNKVSLGEMWAAYVLERGEDNSANKSRRPMQGPRPARVNPDDAFSHLNMSRMLRDAHDKKFSARSCAYVPDAKALKVDTKELVPTNGGGWKRRDVDEEVDFERVMSLTECAVPEEALKTDFPKTCGPLNEVESVEQFLAAFGYEEGKVVVRRKRSLDL